MNWHVLLPATPVSPRVAWPSPEGSVRCIPRCLVPTAQLMPRYGTSNCLPENWEITRPSERWFRQARLASRQNTFCPIYESTAEQTVSSAMVECPGNGRHRTQFPLVSNTVLFKVNFNLTVCGVLPNEDLFEHSRRDVRNF